MKRISVQSRMIASVGYVPEAEELEIEFRSGEVYRYTEVTAEQYETLLAAPSKGRYLQAEIIGKHRFYRV